MSEEKFCELHGPYPASFADCPVCSRRPSAPQTLGEMEEETVVSGSSAYSFSGDEEATEISAARTGIFGEPGDDQTVIGSGASHTQIERHRSGAEAILWVKEGSRRGRWYPIYNNTTIGRKKAELILDDERVSSTHAKITFEKNNYLIWDFGSSNGTFVNGKRIREATVLQENDRIKIGDTVFLLKLLSVKKKTTPTTKGASKTTAKKKSASKPAKSADGK